jgi:DNA-binding NarL/FixJ family response regulator
VQAAADVDDAVRQIAEFRPDVVIVDMATRNSLGVVRRIRERSDVPPVVGFGVDEVEGEILACAEAGLAGYVPSDASLDELVLQIESVLRGELLCTPRMAAALFRHLDLREPSPSQRGISRILTARERQVLHLIDVGLSNKEIAERLNIEVSTVKNHVHNLFDKLHVSSRMQAAAQLGSHVSVRQRNLSPAGTGEID